MSKNNEAVQEQQAEQETTSEKGLALFVQFVFLKKEIPNITYTYVGSRTFRLSLSNPYEKNIESVFVGFPEYPVNPTALDLLTELQIQAKSGIEYESEEVAKREYAIEGNDAIVHLKMFKHGRKVYCDIMKAWGRELVATFLDVDPDELPDV